MGYSKLRVFEGKPFVFKRNFIFWELRKDFILRYKSLVPESFMKRVICSIDSGFVERKRIFPVKGSNISSGRERKKND